MTERLYIGIDPGTTTGVAVWDPTKQKFKQIFGAGIITAMRYVKDWMYKDYDLTLYVEDPNTWKPFDRGYGSRAKIQGAGSIKRDFAIWKEFAEEYDLGFVPTPVQGTAKKTRADYFNQITGWTGSTNQHARDAAMIVFGRV